MAAERKLVKVGSRKSQLALIQTNSVINKLQEVYCDVDFEIITMTTTGDNILDRALSKIGEKNLFTRELEDALLAHQVDFVVHSLKDLPTVLPDGLVIGGVCKRDDSRDAVVFHPKHSSLHSLDDLPDGSVLGTSSLRRGAQVRRKYPKLTLKDLRGNLNTRLRKLTEADDYDALILAVAGLERMSWHDKISVRLEPRDFMYAVGQGAMAVECRLDDAEMLKLLSRIHDYETVLSVIAERSFLKTLEGGCSVPVSVYSCLTPGETEDKLSLKGAVYSIDGSESVIDMTKTSFTTHKPGKDCTREEPELDLPPTYSAITAVHICHRALQAAEDVGTELANTLMKAGADTILRAAKQEIAADIRKQNEARTKDGKTQPSVVKNGVVAVV